MGKGRPSHLLPMIPPSFAVFMEVVILTLQGRLMPSLPHFRVVPSQVHSKPAK